MSESKATIVITTAGHARHLLALAEAREAKLKAEYHATVAKVAEYKELAATLPESAGKPAAKKVVYEVGTVVDFDYGRGDTRVTKTGKITAANEDNTQYLIVVGEGFASEQFKVFGGSIKGVAGETAEAEADPLAPTEDDASAPETPPADDLPFTPDTPESADDPLAA